MLLAYYRGSSREALAKRFGRPVPTIKTWLHRSLAQLRDCLGVMTISPDDDFAAAEYALGTLDASERATLAARRLREPELDEAIRAWEARLAPLAEAAPEIEPPRDLLPAIEARIRGAPPEAPANAAVVALERSVGRWRAVGDRRLDPRRRAGDRHSSRARRRGGPSRTNMWRSCRRTPLRRPSR